MNIVCNRVGADATDIILEFLGKSPRKNYSLVIQEFEKLVEIHNQKRNIRLMDLNLIDMLDNHNFTPSDIERKKIVSKYCHICSNENVKFSCILCFGETCAECGQIDDCDDTCNACYERLKTMIMNVNNTYDIVFPSDNDE